MALMAHHPNYWPETIRALVVHGAAWSDALERERANPSDSRAARENFERRFGMGVPNLERAGRCATNALTIVAQETINPFNDGKLREMHLHALPWPGAELMELGGTLASLRVTLSYFVEPNPGRRGWKKRHRHASHGLRFEVRGDTERTEDFRKRINKAALDENEQRPTAKRDPDWFLGKMARDRGSIHSDTWTGTAADLARRGG